MDIGERIKFVRTDTNHNNGKALTLDQFGKKIGLKKAALSLLENGRAGVTDQTILSICRVFGVSEEWLRYGTGDPYTSISRDQELAAFLAERMSGHEDPALLRLLSILSKLDEDDLMALARIAQKIADEGDLPN